MTFIKSFFLRMDALFIWKLFKLHVNALPGLLSTPSSLTPHPLTPIPSVSAFGFNVLWTLCALRAWSGSRLPPQKGAEAYCVPFAYRTHSAWPPRKRLWIYFCPMEGALKSKF